MSANHTEKSYSIFQIAMNLTAACLVSGVIIAGTFYITAPVAAKNAVIMKNNSMKALVKDADTFKPIKDVKGMEEMGEWYEAQKNEKTIAYVVPGESKGFSGAIKMLVAVTPDGSVIDYDILSHNETPGLGDGAAKEPFRKQFKGKNADALLVVKDPSNTENIQAMTGATITSRAVTKGIKEAVENVKHYTGGK
jgi:Na+-translocating ferredoxin:NAD+ oxidoreductase subunit G